MVAMQLIFPMAVYVVVSVVTFILYAIDKRRAIDSRRRIRESTLHLAELLGGFPGAFVAQRTLRHKNRKLSYQGTFWLIVVVHLAAWAAYLRPFRF